MTEKVFVVEITPVVADDGSTQTFLFGTQAFATKPTDTPANTAVRPLLKNPGSLRRELFSGARVTGAIKPSYGNIVLANPAPDEDSAGELDAWFDYGLSGSKVVVRYGTIGDAYPSAWTTVYIAYAQSFVADLNEITIRLRDRLQLLEQPVVTDGFAGTGGLEGTGGIAKKKQFVAGEPGWFPPILIDPIRQIYFVQSTSDGGRGRLVIGILNTFQAFDNGINLTRQSPNYTSESELLNSPPTQGFAKFYCGPDSSYIPGPLGWKTGPVYMRLGSPPAGDIRVFGRGFPNDDDFDAYGGTIPVFTAGILALRTGLQKVDLDVSADALKVGSIFVDDDKTYNDVLADACLTFQGWYGFTRLDKFRSGTLNDPNDDGYYYGVDPSLFPAAPALQPTISKFEFNFSNVQGLRREPVNGMEAPVWKVSVKAGQTWPSQIANGAITQVRDIFTREVWTSFQGVSTIALLKNPGAITTDVNISGRNIITQNDIRLWLERYFVLYGGRRDFYTFSTPMTEETLALDLADVITLKTPRFGLSAGEKFRIVGIDIQCAAQRGPIMRFTLWGGEIGKFTGYTGGPGSIVVRPPDSKPSAVNPLIFQSQMGEFLGDFFGSVKEYGGSLAGAGASAMGDFTGNFVATVKTVDPLFANVLLLAHGQEDYYETIFYAPLTSNLSDIVYPTITATPNDAGAIVSYTSNGVTITNDNSNNTAQYAYSDKTNANLYYSKLKAFVNISTTNAGATGTVTSKAFFQIGAGTYPSAFRYDVVTGAPRLFAQIGGTTTVGGLYTSAKYEMRFNEIDTSTTRMYIDDVLVRNSTQFTQEPYRIYIGTNTGSTGGIGDFVYKDLYIQRLQIPNTSTIFNSPGTKPHCFLTGTSSVSSEQVKFGSKSIKINEAAGSGIVIDDDGLFSFSNGGLTIEFWAYRNVQTGTVRYLLDTSFGVIRLTFNANTGKLASCYISTSVATRTLTVTSVDFPVSQWVHFALQRNGTRFELFVNGTSVAANTSLTAGETFTISGETFFGRTLSNSSGNSFSGYMQELRITKAARYTSGNFTPPTAPFPDE